MVAEWDVADCDSVDRLLSLSLGQTSLSRDSWLRAKHIELLRRSRMEQHKCVNGNEP